MDGWQCPNCGHSNDRYIYQCRHCQQPRPLESASQTPVTTPWQQGAPEDAAPQSDWSELDWAEPESPPAVWPAPDWADPDSPDSESPKSPDSPTPDYPTPDSPPPGRFVVFTKEELVARCEVCGRYPVQQFQFKGNQGMVVFRQIFGYEGQLCRTCAETVYRNIQSRNLSWGWYGATSFFATISYAISNASNYRQGRRDLGEPVPSPSVDDAKLRVQPIWVTLVTRFPVILVIFGVIALVIWAIYR
jgi:hypothetical protein